MSASISLPSVEYLLQRARASYHVAGGLHDGEEHALRHAPHRRRAAAAQ